MKKIILIAPILVTVLFVSSQIKISFADGNKPNEPIVTMSPKPSFINVAYTIKFSVDDPNKSQVFYQFDWGKNGTWDTRYPDTGFVESDGQIYQIKKAWTEPGDNSFYVRATNTEDAVSNSTSF